MMILFNLLSVHNQYLDINLFQTIFFFSGFSAEIEREAMNIFINLGLGTPKQCLKIFKRCSVYLLIHLTSSCIESQVMPLCNSINFSMFI